jgi:hypothetical protein
VANHASTTATTPELSPRKPAAIAHFRQRAQVHLPNNFRHAPWWITWTGHVALGITLLQLGSPGITNVFGRRPTQRTINTSDVLSPNSNPRAPGAGPDRDPDPILRQEPSRPSEPKPRVVARRLEPLTSATRHI